MSTPPVPPPPPMQRCKNDYSDPLQTLGHKIKKNNHYLVVQLLDLADAGVDFSGESAFNLDCTRVWVLSTSVISLDVSASFKATGYGLWAGVSQNIRKPSPYGASVFTAP